MVITRKVNSLKIEYGQIPHVVIDRLAEEVDMLERHLKVLQTVTENEPIGIVKLSHETDYPHHKVRYSLRVLEEENLVEPSGQGAITTGRTEDFLNTINDKLKTIKNQLSTIK